MLLCRDANHCSATNELFKRLRSLWCTLQFMTVAYTRISHRKNSRFVHRLWPVTRYFTTCASRGASNIRKFSPNRKTFCRTLPRCDQQRRNWLLNAANLLQQQSKGDRTRFKGPFAFVTCRFGVTCKLSAGQEFFGRIFTWLHWQ